MPTLNQVQTGSSISGTLTNMLCDFAAAVDTGSCGFDLCHNSHLTGLLLDGFPAQAFQSYNASVEA